MIFVDFIKLVKKNFYSIASRFINKQIFEKKNKW